jgi:hypothetical protein
MHQEIGEQVYASSSLGYPISAFFSGFTIPIEDAPEVEQQAFCNILKAIDFWSAALSGTHASPVEWDGTLFTGRFDTFNLPIYDDFKDVAISPGQTSVSNNGLVLYIEGSNADNGVLGYAGLSYLRFAAGPDDPYGTDSLMPSEAYLAFNTFYVDNTLTPTPKGLTENYYVILHEIGHTLGLGTMWHYYDAAYNDPTYGPQPALIYRSLIVGAGDTATTTLNLGPSANFFYSTTNINRTELDTGKHTTIGTNSANIGDADYTDAFNGFSDVTGPSKAVNEYAAAYDFNLTAIPVENGRGFGSIGSHFEEGWNSDATYGTDDRTYYGNSAPGAPGLEDELMTPQSEGNGIDLVPSRITFGALEDLGYTVNYDMATDYQPLLHRVVYNGNPNEQLRINKYTHSSEHQGQLGANENSNSFYGTWVNLKRGLTYQFKVESSSPIKLMLNGSVMSEADGVQNNNISNGDIIYSVPTTGLAVGTVGYIHAAEPNAKMFFNIT